MNKQRAMSNEPAERAKTVGSTYLIWIFILKNTIHITKESMNQRVKRCEKKLQFHIFHISESGVLQFLPA